MAGRISEEVFTLGLVPEVNARRGPVFVSVRDAPCRQERVPMGERRGNLAEKTRPR
jgi:hypothetical protein